jgi:hypothetical protein
MNQRLNDLEYMDTVMVNYDDEEDAQEEMLDKSKLRFGVFNLKRKGNGGLILARIAGVQAGLKT